MRTAWHAPWIMLSLRHVKTSWHMPSGMLLGCAGPVSSGQGQPHSPGPGDGQHVQEHAQLHDDGFQPDRGRSHQRHERRRRLLCVSGSGLCSPVPLSQLFFFPARTCCTAGPCYTDAVMQVPPVPKLGAMPAGSQCSCNSTGSWFSCITGCAKCRTIGTCSSTSMSVLGLAQRCPLLRA